jgi:hypothetical protein
MESMSRIDADLGPRATAAQLKSARPQLKQLASRHGLSSLRLADEGTLVVHVEFDPTYRSVLKFIAQATHLLQAEPHVITDDSPIAGRLQTTPL